MSTKTSIKRIAAVAAVALTLGGFTAVSAHAATGAVGEVIVTAAQGTNNFGTTPNATETATATAGANSYVGLLVQSATATPVVVVVTGGTAVSSATTVTGSGTASLLASTAGDTAINIPTPTVGTIVVKTYVITGGLQASSATTTLTITVAAAATGVGTLSTGASSGYITSVKAAGATPATVHNVLTASTLDGSGAAGALAADVAVLAAKGPAGSSAIAGAIYGVLKDSQTPTAAGMTAKTLTATISGSGLLTGNSGTDTNLGISPARVATTITSTSNPGEYAFNVYSDGSAGTGTVTISYTDSSNVTTVVATKTITFYGAQATFTPTVKYSYIPNSGSLFPQSVAASSDPYYAVKIAVKDSAGNAVAGIAPLVKSSDTTILSGGTCQASSASSGTSYCSLTGVSGAHGKVTVTFYTGATTSFDLVSTTADITVSGTAAASFAITADSSASSGNVITYTITATDKWGQPIADRSLVTDYMTVPVVAGGAMMDYSALLGNTAATLFTKARFVGGVATDSVQAPFGSTKIVATFDNIGGGSATLVDSHFTTLALTNAETVLTTTVGGTSDAAAQAAVDAAQEATDAANAAYDAANNAMDSADAATAAAQDASDNAAAALAAVTSLSATVAKLVASVSAITTALASIKKKLGVK